MRHVILAAALAAGLTACGTITGGGSVDPRVLQVQEYAKTACGFLPTAATIDALLNAGSFSGYIALGQAICDAVMRANQMRSGKTPVLNGVILEGTFVGR
jgi:hypothetical protein